MKKIILVFVLLVLPASLQAEEQSCIGCHETATPAAITQWQGSAHFPSVGCSDCHGTDHERMRSGEISVTAHTCGNCHQQAFSEHASSKHSLGLHTGWGCTRNMPDRNREECKFCHDENSSLAKSKVQCARFLKQTGEMRAIGCNRCHEVENSCQSCHSNHLTDLEIVRSSRICAKCHMGPDHPQWEMWETSLHGSLNMTMGDSIGPSCQSCHMPQGSHDVSLGITVTTGGNDIPLEKATVEREKMLDVCAKCHARDFARRDLEVADKVRQQANDILKEAETRIRQIGDQNLLEPSPSERPKHPLSGNTLVLDSQMLYEDYSHLERLFFKMKKYDHAKTWKGAYHQNPAYTHWYGNAELKMDLVDIKAEATRLEKQALLMEGGGSTPGKVDDRDELERLTDDYRRGRMSEQEFQEARKKLLESFSGDGK
ncbi:MAG: hypothetical protein C0616_03755 [Desulfuromonas sp.]|nr:MAG: hypothetical protein C0616_03755 [Desulfuromonas sp.]